MEPSLLENWVSAAFAFFGQDPITFVLFKNVFGFAILALLTVAWGFLGHALGFMLRNGAYKTFFSSYMIG